MERERKAKMQVERQQEERHKKAVEQRRKEEQKRQAVEEKRKQKQEEEKVANGGALCPWHVFAYQWGNRQELSFLLINILLFLYAAGALWGSDETNARAKPAGWPEAKEMVLGRIVNRLGWTSR